MRTSETETERTPSSSSSSSLQEGVEVVFLKRSFSSPDVQVVTAKNYDADNNELLNRRCHSWNGCTALEREEMANFFVDDEEENSSNNSDGGEGDGSSSKYNRYLRKAGVAVVGGSMVGAGIILIPLPGPGILVMGAGASVLAKEFPAAQRAIDTAKDYCTSLINGGKAGAGAGAGGGTGQNDNKGEQEEEEGVPEASAANDDTTSASSANDDEDYVEEEEEEEEATGQAPEEESATTTTKEDASWGAKYYKKSFLSMGRTFKEGFNKGTKKLYEKSKRFGTTIDQFSSASKSADLVATTN